MKTFFLAALAPLLVLACTSSSERYGTLQDCIDAGGQCVGGLAASACTKQGPDNTCNCNPTCNSSGGVCCLAFYGPGDAAASGGDAGGGD